MKYHKITWNVKVYHLLSCIIIHKLYRVKVVSFIWFTFMTLKLWFTNSSWLLNNCKWFRLRSEVMFRLIAHLMQWLIKEGFVLNDERNPWIKTGCNKGVFFSKFLAKLMTTLEFQRNILKQTDESNKYFWSAHDMNISRLCQWKPKSQLFCNFYDDINTALKKKK